MLVNNLSIIRLPPHPFLSLSTLLSGPHYVSRLIMEDKQTDGGGGRDVEER